MGEKQKAPNKVKKVKKFSKEKLRLEVKSRTPSVAPSAVT